MITVSFFIPIIYIQRLYHWIPALTFAYLGPIMKFLEYKFEESSHSQLLRTIRNLIYTLGALSIVPSLFMYKYYLIVIIFILLGVANSIGFVASILDRDDMEKIGRRIYEWIMFASLFAMTAEFVI